MRADAGRKATVASAARFNGLAHLAEVTWKIAENATPA